MIVYLVRHTSVVNDRKLCYGQSEMDLTPDFEVEAAAVAAQLPSKIEVCISSPLKRCTQLAEYLCADSSLVVQIDDALKEFNFGEWEQVPWDEIDQQALDAWSKDFVHHPCPGGESFEQLHERVLQFWEQLHTKYRDQTVLLVTHGGVIRSLLTHAQHKPLKDAFEFNVEPGAVFRFES